LEGIKTPHKVRKPMDIEKRTCWKGIGDSIALINVNIVIF